MLDQLTRLRTGPLGRFTGRAFAGLLGVVGTGVAFGLLTLLVRAKWPPLQRFDIDIAVAMNHAVADQPGWLAVLRAVTTLGSGWVLWLVTAPAVVGLFIARRPRLALYLVVTGLGAQVLTPTLKTLIGRLRPVVPDPVAVEASKSFPSGHSLGSFVVYGAMLLVFLPLVSARWRRPLTVAVGLLVFAIGFTRIALGVHFVTDVLGGWLIGFAWLGVTAFAFGLWRREERAESPPAESPPAESPPAESLRTESPADG